MIMRVVSKHILLAIFVKKALFKLFKREISTVGYIF